MGRFVHSGSTGRRKGVGYTFANQCELCITSNGRQRGARTNASARRQSHLLSCWTAARCVLGREECATLNSRAVFLSRTL
jgi:hypothetical protein